LIDYEQFCGLRGEPRQTDAMFEITPEELDRRRKSGEDIFILDVRQPHEYQIANLGGHLIPLNDLAQRVNELDPKREIVVHCKTGGRSAQAADILRQAGFQRVLNLQGGILAWAERVDPAIAKY
jgi:adenylyltransferase/sulfurtransferase